MTAPTARSPPASAPRSPEISVRPSMSPPPSHAREATTLRSAVESRPRSRSRSRCNRRPQHGHFTPRFWGERRRALRLRLRQGRCLGPACDRNISDRTERPHHRAADGAAKSKTRRGKPARHVARLLNFFAITDIHITDKESPSSAIYLGLKNGISSGYSPVMLDTTHVLDAAVQTINE